MNVGADRLYAALTAPADYLIVCWSKPDRQPKRGAHRTAQGLRRKRIGCVLSGDYGCGSGRFCRPQDGTHIHRIADAMHDDNQRWFMVACREMFLAGFWPVGQEYDTLRRLSVGDRFE